jgi:dihydroflavonol-4-reductase
VTGDVCRAGELVRSLAGCRYLVHCAALYSFAPAQRKRLREVNVAGTARLLEAARIAGVERAVVTSSSATVGPSRLGQPADETCNPVHWPMSAYHHSKVEQERVAIAARVPVVLVLPTAPVGPGDHKPTPTGRVVLDFACGRMPARPSGGGLNVVAVEDVAAAHVAALESGKPRERYIAGGENLSFDRLWELLAQVTGRPVPPWRVPHTIALAAAVADEIRCRLQPRAVPVVPLEGVQLSREYMYADSAKAARELGYRASSVIEALARAVAWYRAHGYIAA